MPKHALAPLFLAGCLLLAACSTFAPAPTETPVPSATLLPTETPAPTATVTPVRIAETPDIFIELNPLSLPLKEWNGIPIMPGALAGDGGETSYYFTTESTAQAIQAFYDRELPKIGYASLAVGTGKDNTLVLFYQGSSQVSDAALSISLFTKGELVLVMMVK